MLCGAIWLLMAGRLLFDYAQFLADLADMEKHHLVLPACADYDHSPYQRGFPHEIDIYGNFSTYYPATPKRGYSRRGLYPCRFPK
jgi:hypothetical protein